MANPFFKKQSVVLPLGYCMNFFCHLTNSLDHYDTHLGRKISGEARSDILLKTNVYFADNNECDSTYKGDKKFVKGFDATTMICAGNKLEGNNTCYVSMEFSDTVSISNVL